MKTAIRVGMVLGGMVSAAASLAAERLYDVTHHQEVSWVDLSTELAKADIVVLGEEHYTPSVQDAEGRIIRNTVQIISDPTDFVVGWEFLNYSEKARNDSLYAQLRSGGIDSAQFLQATQGIPDAKTYVPMIDAVAETGGALLSLNLSHEEKAPVVKSGIHALNPALLPPGYASGSALYLERFKAAMGQHAPADQMSNYFDAQCLTDDVMAYHLLQGGDRAMRFLVAGNFHMEFGEGVVARIRARAPMLKTVTVRIYDGHGFANPEQDMETRMHDARYGDVADYAVFMNLR